jgi:hypothetical protein
LILEYKIARIILLDFPKEGGELFMGSFGGFYKGEKKKKKKDSKNISSSFTGMGAPTFSMPKIIEKKKKEF